jgi:hypothetical protein
MNDGMLGVTNNLSDFPEKEFCGARNGIVVLCTIAAGELSSDTSYRGVKEVQREG